MTGLGVAVGIVLVFSGIALGAGVLWRQVAAEPDQVRGELDVARERVIALEQGRDHYRREAHRWWRSSRLWKRRALEAEKAHGREVSA